jgi:hypothetical protein
LTLYIFIVPVVWFVSWSIYFFLLGFKDYRVTWYKNINNFVFFNGTFIFVDEFYLLLAISAALNTFYLRWDTNGDIFNSCCALGMGGVVVLAPFFFLGFYGSS